MRFNAQTRLGIYLLIFGVGYVVGYLLMRWWLT